jgi:undecaprenyl-diphosphatase
MNPLHAALLGIVEGLTEYLPISSTGHLILVDHFLKQQSEANQAFDIVIQLGAILAVLVHYRTLIRSHLTGLVRKESASFRLLLAIVLGFIPTAVVGLLFHKAIKKLLFFPRPVAIALMVGGVVMIAVQFTPFFNRKEPSERVEQITPLQGFLIGVGQCFALIPGSSRSMCTIVTGKALGLSTALAAEFSFLLGLPTLGAATVYELLKSWKTLTSASGSGLSLAIGLVVSFVVAWAVIGWFLAFLKKRGLAAFGVYRILLGIVVLVVIH